jgi:uncharacterized Zn finger protein
MASIPTLSETEIRQRVGDQSYQRGVGYFENEAIVNPRRQGSTLKAQCWGTAEEPYRVTITFAGDAIERAECTCPIGHGGFCKHVAAVLMAWRAHPDEFVEIEELASALERRTKPELIALINQLLLRDPDLELLLELPLPTGYPAVPPARVDAIRRQAAGAFNRHPPGEWGVEGQIADEIFNLKTIGDSFAAQNDPASAAAVYEALATEVIANFESYPYDEGELSGVVEACVDSLAGLLASSATAAEARTRVLAALVAIFRANLDEAADYELHGPRAMALVVEHATPTERPLVADWLREARDATASRGAATESLDEDEWDDESDDEDSGDATSLADYDEAIFDLEKDTLDDETFFTTARRLGRVADQVERLLQRDRLDEAVALAGGAAARDLPATLDHFVGHGHDDLAELIASERSGANPDPTLLDWRYRHHARRGHLAEALPLAERLFQSQPSLTLYAQIREYATTLGCWPPTRDELRAALRRTNRWSTLVEAELEDGDVAAAIAETLGQATETGDDVLSWLGDTASRVAAAAEASHPREAIEIYTRRAKRHIAARQRPSYHEAAMLLGHARRLYHTLGEIDQWNRFIEDLRARYNRLPALKDELAQAGL